MKVALLVLCIVLAVIPGAQANGTNPFDLLASAGPTHWAVLGLGGISVTPDLTNETISGPPWNATNIFGNIGVAPVGNFTISGNSHVTGALYLNSTGILNQSGPSTISEGMITGSATDTLLQHAVTDAMAAYNAARVLPSTVTTLTNVSTSQTTTSFSSIVTSTTSYSLTGHSGLNVVNLTDLTVGPGSLTLNAPSNAQFVINISHDFSTGDGGNISLAGGLTPTNVLYNVIGGTTGGCGSPEFPCVNFGKHQNPTQISGIVLAPSRDIQIAPGLLTGEIIGGGNTITIASGTDINSFCPVPEPCSLILLGSGMFVVGFWRRRA